MMPYVCARCGVAGEKSSSQVNRSNKIGSPIYCGRECASAARRTDTRTPEERRTDKRAYDADYRERNREQLKAKHAAYYAKVGPTQRDREREIRQKRMPLHVEYCRQPEYKAKKHEYDIARVSSRYGDFAEAHRILVELGREIRRLMPDKYERLKARGYYERQNEKVKERRNVRRLNSINA